MRIRLAGATRATFQSLRVRNFRLFFAGQLVSQVGNWLTMIAETLLVLELTHSGFAVGVLAACQFAPVLVLGAWAGPNRGCSPRSRSVAGRRSSRSTRWRSSAGAPSPSTIPRAVRSSSRW